MAHCWHTYVRVSQMQQTVQLNTTCLYQCWMYNTSFVPSENHCSRHWCNRKQLRRTDSRYFVMETLDMMTFDSESRRTESKFWLMAVTDVKPRLSESLKNRTRQWLIIITLITKTVNYKYTNLFRLLPSRWCRRFSPCQPSVLCQWPSLGWRHRCACHFSVSQAISSLDVLWVGFPSPSCSTCFLLCGYLPFASHAHTMIVVFGSGLIW